MFIEGPTNSLQCRQLSSFACEEDIFVGDDEYQEHISAVKVSSYSCTDELGVELVILLYVRVGGWPSTDRPYYCQRIRISHKFLSASERWAEY